MSKRKYPVPIGKAIAGITLLYSASLFTQCKSPDSSAPSAQPSTTISLVEDTIRRNAVQNEVNEIISKLDDESHHLLIIPEDSSGIDSIEYWLLDGRVARASFKLYSPESMSWPTFIFKDGQLLVARYRHWSKVPPMPWAEELMVYYMNGKVFYCDERKTDLPDGQIPAFLRTKPFIMSQRSFPEIEQNYTGYLKHLQNVFSQKGISF